MEKGWLKLEDRVVIVTGGASGIAKHTVQTLAAAGVLWRLPPNLEPPQKAPKNVPEQPAPEQEIQEDTTDE